MPIDSYVIDIEKLAEVNFSLCYLLGIKKTSGVVDGEIRLRASGFIKDISIHMLSDDNFSEVQLIYLTIFSFL